MNSVWTRTLFALPIAAGLAASLPAWAEPSRPVPVGEKKVTTGIEWAVAPKEVVIYLDGKKIGIAGDLSVTEAKPGKHEVRLVNGQDETEMDVNVEKGKVLRIEFAFEGK